MASHGLKIDRSKLHAVGMDAARKLVGRVIRRTLNRSAVLCPVDTGRLRASGSMKIASLGSEVVGTVEYNTDYAAAVHEGRRELTIRPRTGRALRFKIDGRVVYARSVHQPARKGRPFLYRALQEVAKPEGFRVVRIG